MHKSSEKVRSAADAARPYVQRAITDEEFRESLRSAFVAAKEIYEELMPSKGVSGLASKVATDEDIQQSLKRAVVELRNAADRIQTEQEEQMAESHGFRNAMLVLIGVAIGIFFNPFTGPEARRWVKGQVSGGEFSYNGHDTAESISA